IFDLSNGLTIAGKPVTDRVFPQWFGAKVNDTQSDSDAINQAVIFSHNKGGATVFFPSGEYRITETISMKSNVLLEGEGDSSVLYNVSKGVNTIEAIGELPDYSFDPPVGEYNRIHSIGFKKLLLKGNLNTESGETGIHIENSFSNFWPRVHDPPDPVGDYYSKRRGDPIVIIDVNILHHQKNGI